MKAKLVSFFKKHYAYCIYITFYFFAFSHKLIFRPDPFYDWDESIYAQVAREMIEKFSLVPLWQGEIWLDKPPLVPLFYGIIMKITPFIPTDISTRMATLILTIVLLSMLYFLYYRVMKETFLTTLVIMLTSLVPIFLQRSQVLNIDVFLLIGWTGYIMFYKNFRWSLFFLAVGVLSKTLVGFYPAAIVFLFYCFLFITKKIKRSELFNGLKNIFIQVGIVGIWYMIMFALYGKAFWVQHIYETHFKRVSASIESHFGQRTYYIDLLLHQFTSFNLFIEPRNWISITVAIVMLGGIFTILYRYFIAKKKSSEELLESTFILPWFAFLNLAKTKIFWYSYPYITQFAFVLLYPLVFLRRWKLIYYGTLVVIAAMIFNFYFIQQNVLNAHYSSYDAHYEIAEFAKKNCSELHSVVSKDTRTAYATLKSMDLVITTTTWWGDHPSMVYYFGKKINFVYNIDNFENLVKTMNSNSCLVVNKNDRELLTEGKNLKELKGFGDLYIYKK